MRRPEVKGNDRLVVLGFAPFVGLGCVLDGSEWLSPLLQLIWNGRVSSFPSA